MHSLTARPETVPYVPLMIAELERGEDETFVGIASGSLFAPADDLPVGIGTPEAVKEAGATPDAAAMETSRRHDASFWICGRNWSCCQGTRRASSRGC
jgi:hypothetical protein